MNGPSVMPEKGAVVLLGPAGSGKTTIARALSGVGVSVIETGNLLEAEIRGQTALASQIKPYKIAGELVPSALVKQVISAELERFQGTLVVFDGFPRSPEQVESLLELLRIHGRKLQAVIVLTLDLEASIQRLSGRRLCSQCGALYNIFSTPPNREGICDRCGGVLAQRGDDREELVRRRFETFQRETVPVIDFFRREYPGLTWEIPARLAAPEVVGRIREKLNGDR